MTTNRGFTVTVSFDLDADTPEEAAEIVADWLSGECDPWLLAMDVTNADGTTIAVVPSSGVVE